MKNNRKAYIVIFLLITAIIIIHTVPQVQYTGTNFISKIKFPEKFAEWKGRDISDVLDINLEEAQFNFINDAVAYNYIDSHGNNLIFIVLDAGNFHNPKVCFTSSGYELKDLEDTDIPLIDRTIKAHTLLTEKNGKSTLSFYWIVIDKNIADDWIEQKFKQLYFSILNKNMIGLMVRLDIPLQGRKVEDAIALGKQFYYDLQQSIEPQHVDYLFGEK
ncbi:hypothetical protein BMS3Abin15_00301 [bacterium BMS3Abin15]|nr:hypothetical protein BMS3Abin15_00301 [bacterium BMS3Abin15]